jgi:hypothetical protein
MNAGKGKQRACYVYDGEREQQRRLATGAFDCSTRTPTPAMVGAIVLALGGQTPAAGILGVSYPTLTAWRSGRSRPSNLEWRGLMAVAETLGWVSPMTADPTADGPFLVAITGDQFPRVAIFTGGDFFVDGVVANVSAWRRLPEFAINELDWSGWVETSLSAESRSRHRIK